MSEKSKFSPFLLLCTFGLLLLCVPQPASAQFRASIQGTATDPTGGVVPNAKVTLLSEETQATQQTNTSGEGFYVFNRLAPGRYTVTVEAPGFQKSIREHVEAVAEQPTGVNIVLTAGQVTETVTVSAETAPQLETENASIDGTITSQQVQRLPQVGRDPYETLRFTPGVFGLGARDTSGGAVSPPNTNSTGGSSTSIFATENVVPVTGNGQRPSENTYEIDGVSVNSQTWGGAAVVTPSQESVKEMRVSSSSYSAETRSSGIAVQVVSNNGTNDIHGSAFFKYDSPSLNSYARWAGPFGGLPQKNLNLFRQFGGSVGGPIIKNHLFAFFTYETLRQNNGNLTNLWVETPQFITAVQRLRPNSIAATIVGQPGNLPRILSVLNGNCGQLGLAAGQCQAVAGGLDVGSPINSSTPLTTNVVGGGLDGVPDLQYVQAQNFGKLNAAQYNGRVDWQIGQNDRIFFSEFFIPYDNTFPNGTTQRQNNYWDSGRLNIAAALVWTRTLSATMVNEARFNITRWTFNELDANPQIPWGIPQDTVSYGGQSLQWGAPGPGIFGQTAYNFRDTLLKVAGSHSLKFGVDVAKEQNNDVVGWSARPQYDFGNMWNFMNDKPIDENGGGFDPRTGAPTSLHKYIRNSVYAGFVQDDWKLRPNLTLNLGLRWDYYSPLTEKYGNISNILLGSGANALTGARVVTGGEQWNRNYNNWGPQLGFAWSPGSGPFSTRLAIRGGFGIGYNRVPLSELLNGRLNPPLYNSPFIPANLLVYGLSNLGINGFNGFPAIPSAIQTFDPASGLPVPNALASKPNLFVIPQNFPQPIVYRYSLNIQYDLGKNWVAALAYQGSEGRHFERETNFSLLYPANPAVNKFAVVQNDVNTSFNAFLVYLQKRMSSGVQVAAQYRWAKAIDDGCSTDQNCNQPWPFDRRLERGPSDFDVKHYFTGTALWDLPIFRDRSRWTGRLLGGWEINGVVTASTGFPWTPVYRDVNCDQIAGQGGLCPSLPTAYLRQAGQDYSTSTFQRANGNFPGGGAAYFAFPPAGVLIPPTPGIGRNVFRGPNYFQIDSSASKRFTLPKLPIFGEIASLDLRVNAFNLFNKLNLSPFTWNSQSTQVNSSSFGQAVNVLAGRVVELQARFSF